jgi:hypothetical protein
MKLEELVAKTYETPNIYSFDFSNCLIAQAILELKTSIDDLRDTILEESKKKYSGPATSP